jgi:anti-anti-sigma regulatory factor
MTRINGDKVETTEQERKGFADFWRLQEQHKAELDAQVLAAANAIPAFETIIRTTPKDVMDKQGAVSNELARKALLEDQWGPYLENLRVQGATYAALGVPFRAWLELTTVLKRHLVGKLVAAYGADPPRLSAAFIGMDRYIDVALAVIGDSYLATKEELINKQQRAILELSTPVLPMRDRLLILPIVGVLDTRRARQLTEQLLQAVRAHRAKVVVVDITGVPGVDSKVANHILQTVKAARLMGARVVVTGLSPEVAQALVALGVELSTLQTVGDLQGGIELAEEMLGYKVTRVAAPRVAPLIDGGE